MIPHLSIFFASSMSYLNNGITACHTQTPHSIAIDVSMYLSWKQKTMDVRTDKIRTCIDSVKNQVMNILFEKN